MAEGNSSGKLLNRKARPRVAALGFWATQSEVLDSIEPLCGTLYRDSLPNLKEVDLVIARGYLDEPLSAHVLLWGPDSAHEIRRPYQSTWNKAAAELLWDIEETTPTPLQFANADRIRRRKGKGLSGPLMDLIGPELAAIGRSEQIGHEIYTEPDSGAFESAISQLFADTQSDPSRVAGIDSLRVGEIPLVWTSDASLVALYSPVGDEVDRRTLGETKDWAWIGLSIPPQAKLRVWFACFLEFLHEADRDAVPRRPPRFGSPTDWHTPDQVALAEKLTAVDGAIDQLLGWRADLESEIESAGAVADAGIRRVLGSKGDDLESAVADLLRDLGFDVTVVDDELEPNQPKREDLRLAAPESESVILAEVKGYPNDAKVSDLSQIRTQRELFIQATGSVPLSWWIFNDHINTPDPSDRPEALQGHLDRVESHGVVAIPTRELYRLWRSVGLGEIAAEDARRLLVEGTPGPFKPPSLSHA